MIKSVVKAIDIMELLAGKGGSMTLSELSSKLSQNVNTVKGLLNTLMSKGYVKQDGQRGAYSLGWRVQYLAEGLASEASLKSTVHPYLEKLHELSGREAVYCSLVSGRQFMCLDYIDSDHELGIRPGKAYIITGNLHIYAQGKLILANLTEEELERYLQTERLSSFTARTVTSHDALSKELKDIRKRNMSIVRDEGAVGISSIASGISNPEGRLIATIAVSFPSDRLPSDYNKNIGMTLVKFADEITDKLKKGVRSHE